ncbi:MAG: carboxylesterase family protein [Acidimicrobiia bacterium]
MTRVDTPFGPVRGTERTIDGTTVLHFGGVPYAQAERFGLPQRVEWTDELDATRPGAAAPQTIGGLDLVPGMAPEHQSEDCLLAEIFTTDVGGNAPVLVWVPGGSYRIGGAASTPTTAARLPPRARS